MLETRFEFESIFSCTPSENPPSLLKCQLSVLGIVTYWIEDTVGFLKCVIREYTDAFHIMCEQHHTCEIQISFDSAMCVRAVYGIRNWKIGMGVISHQRIFSKMSTPTPPALPNQQAWGRVPQMSAHSNCL